MRGFIFKAIIVTFIFIIGFEFTIGKRIDPIVENIDKFTNEQGRKELINKLRKEMKKGLEKEDLDSVTTLLFAFVYMGGELGKLEKIEKVKTN